MRFKYFITATAPFWRKLFVFVGFAVSITLILLIVGVIPAPNTENETREIDSPNSSSSGEVSNITNDLESLRSKLNTFRYEKKDLEKGYKKATKKLAQLENRKKQLQNSIEEARQKVIESPKNPRNGTGDSSLKELEDSLAETEQSIKKIREIRDKFESYINEREKKTEELKEKIDLLELEKQSLEYSE